MTYGNRPIYVRPAATIKFIAVGRSSVGEEVDRWGFPIEPAERMQQVMLRFYDLLDEADMADFPSDLIAEAKQVRLKFMDEFERRFPGYGEGRAIWR